MAGQTINLSQRVSILNDELPAAIIEILSLAGEKNLTARIEINGKAGSITRAGCLISVEGFAPVYAESWGHGINMLRMAMAHNAEAKTSGKQPCL